VQNKFNEIVSQNAAKSGVKSMMGNHMTAYQAYAAAKGFDRFRRMHGAINTKMSSSRGQVIS
jgi:hypothetical protein